MAHTIKTIAIILARGGSKGIPKKNIMDFCGKPLIAWSILQAINTPEIDKVFVSSDSGEILNIAKKYGAYIVKRPNEISGDTATPESAIEHVLKVIGFSPDTIIMIQATSPLRKPDDLSRAINQFNIEKWDSAFSGAILNDFLIWKKDHNGILSSINYDYRKRGRRQDRESQFVENGSFYIFRYDTFISNGNVLSGNIGILLMDFWQSFELDTPEDIDLVGTLFDDKLRHLYDNV